MSEDNMMEELVYETLKEKISSAVDALAGQLKKLRTGRASVDILDGINVDYFGSMTPLSQCANLSVPDARTIIVQPWDKSIMPNLEKAIVMSGIGITPQNDGQIIRLPIPPLTEDRRKDLVKQAKTKGEDAKISVRNARRDANEALKKAEKGKEMSKDDLKRAMDNVQSSIDEGIKKCDSILVAKEKEILDI